MKSLCLPNDFVWQVVALRPRLLEAARPRVRKQAWVEDAASQTTLAGLKRRAAALGPWQRQTWLMGSLKHKRLGPLLGHAFEPRAWAPPAQPAHRQQATQSTRAATDRREPVRLVQDKQAPIQVDTRRRNLSVPRCRAREKPARATCPRMACRQCLHRSVR